MMVFIFLNSIKPLLTSAFSRSCYFSTHFSREQWRENIQIIVFNNPSFKIVEMELYNLVDKKIHQQTINQSYGPR